MAKTVSYFGLHLSAETECLKCICLDCYNPDCPHIKRQEKRCKDWITSRCHYCYIAFQPNRKPLDYCSFFIPRQRPRVKHFTILRKYRKKTQLQTILEKLNRIERLLEKDEKP